MTYIRHGSLFRENAADGLEVEEETPAQAPVLRASPEPMKPLRPG